MGMKTKVTVEECSIYVQGMDLKCPLCGVVVKPGKQHACKTVAKPVRALKPKRGKGER